LNIFNKLLLSSTLLFVACGTTSDNTEVEKTPQEKIKSKLDTISTDADFTLLLKSEKNKTLSHSIGKSKESTIYRSASTSKWVTATVILSLVKDGILSLDDHPQTYIPNWNSSGNLSKITLKQLLNFTSGLTEEPFCLSLANYDFESCVENIATKNKNSKVAGEAFYYGANHLQVAGLMAIKASGKASWQELFEDFKKDTNLFSTSYYDLPSLSNPRLAGGMHWNAKEYLAFLEALYKEEILTPQLITMMTSDQLEKKKIENSPAKLGIKEDWHYGFGTWIECHNTTNDCDKTTRVSCPGLYGAYPFIDYEHNYYGILAREGKLGTFIKGYELFKKVSDDLEDWAKED
jgi:CubicO group peptidase (beta-lactamase class C family)